MSIRPFEDLIKPIEYDGETFVPIEEIAKMATIRNVINISTRLNRLNTECIIIFKNEYVDKLNLEIDKNFNIDFYAVENGNCLFMSNQVQIVKNLIKWGFIEP